ncbi:hypothetical protein [Mesobacterium pallidum]|uniref:hypothetical protein n=1 Tax=Mesobacterium pallidum TaxID=2872037 RepID=UPI001EE2C03D|nr:hypothetical protein [Mesobacterium pallidum]
MPNAIAYLVLALWPLVTIFMFRKWPLERALIWSLLGAYLFLPPPPAAFDFPLMPPLDKSSLPSLTTFAVVLYHMRDKVSLLPASGLGKFLVAVFVLVPILTVLTNGEAVVWGNVWIKPLGIKDILALTILQAITLLPFLMARQILSKPAAQRELLVALFVGGLIYSLPMLAEVRLSPQLNIKLYGYFQHNWLQMVRDGGFRPIVFMYHGLWVAFFAMQVFVAAVILARVETEPRRKVLFAVAAVYLLAVLVLCKSLGAILFAALLAPLVLFTGRRFQLTVAATLAILAITYPLSRGTGLVPIDAIVDLAAKVSPDRAHSIQFRFDNEGVLLDRAAEKPWFGWGSWGRNHVYNPITGAIETVTDGLWIIAIGVFGWVGFLAQFVLIALPILYLWRESFKRHVTPLTPYVGPLALMLGVNMADMIPNATLTPITWFLCGALLGYAEELRGQRVTRARSAPLGWRSVM